MSFEEATIGPCRLIRGDCLDVLPTLAPGSVDAVVTDPPYEGMVGGTVMKWGGGVSPRTSESKTVGNELGTSDAIPVFARVAKRGAIVFCSYHWIERCIEMLGGKRVALLTWYKRNSPASVQNAPWFETEFAWAVQFGVGIEWRKLRTLLNHPLLQAGCFAVERLVDDGKAIHPAQKPIALMNELILPGMDSVCDPYMGLGTTGISCVRADRSFIGIEKEQKYFDIACRRIERAWADRCNRLPFDSPQSMKQRELEMAQ